VVIAAKPGAAALGVSYYSILRTIQGARRGLCFVRKDGEGAAREGTVIAAKPPEVVLVAEGGLLRLCEGGSPRAYASSPLKPRAFA